MATRAKRTIDPKKVTDLDSWLKGYRSKYGNLVRRGGDYLVLDPVKYKEDYKAALAAPEKVIASVKAVDAQRILGTVSEFPQLRATAEETMKELHEEQQKRIKVASDAVNKAEADLLTITQTWKAARYEGASIRSALALDVAKATVAMEQAEAALSAAQYPVRYIKAEKELLIKDLDYATHSDKRFHNELYRLVTKPTALSGRIIPFTEEGKV
jgi:hypothetical protein|uniref:Uncharacterized protein n=1 Tax=viral metagenome TaxID=1070528 RepID=A0A6C0LNY8_9ZZZZ